MPMFDGIKKWFNPTCYWRKHFSELVVDLRGHCLNGAAAGDSLDEFKFLGPGKMRRDYSISVDYPDFGIALHTGGHGLCDSFLIAFEKLEYPQGFKPFSGTFVFEGRSLSNQDLGNYEKVKENLGEPYCSHKDHEEFIFFYEISPVVEWQIEFSPSGKTRAIIISSVPLLEDEEQRLFYGCDGLWPPK